MRRRVGTGSRNPAEAWSGAAKVFTNVCTVFFGMVRAQRGGAEPSPPPYVYSILGRAPPLCTVSSGRASVYCLAAGRRGWCRAVPAGSACSSLVRRVLEAYNGCQNESAAHGRPHTRYTHAYILYPDSRNQKKDMGDGHLAPAVLGAGGGALLASKGMGHPTPKDVYKLLGVRGPTPKDVYKLLGV